MGGKTTRCFKSQNKQSIMKNILEYERKSMNMFFARQSKNFIPLLKALKNTVF